MCDGDFPRPTWESPGVVSGVTFQRVCFPLSWAEPPGTTKEGEGAGDLPSPDSPAPPPQGPGPGSPRTATWCWETRVQLRARVENTTKMSARLPTGSCSSSKGNVSWGCPRPAAEAPFQRRALTEQTGGAETGSWAAGGVGVHLVATSPPPRPPRVTSHHGDRVGTNCFPSRRGRDRAFHSNPEKKTPEARVGNLEPKDDVPESNERRKMRVIKEVFW